MRIHSNYFLWRSLNKSKSRDKMAADIEKRLYDCYHRLPYTGLIDSADLHDAAYEMIDDGSHIYWRYVAI